MILVNLIMLIICHTRTPSDPWPGRTSHMNQKHIEHCQLPHHVPRSPRARTSTMLQQGQTSFCLVIFAWAIIILVVTYFTKMVFELPEDTLLLRGSEL